MKYQLLLLVTLYCFYACSEGRRIDHEASAHHAKRAVGDPAGPPAPVETPAETLMRLKLLTYQEKLKAKEAKKTAKANKKAAKELAFATYMSSLMPPPAAPGVAAPAPAAPATPALAAPVPALPMVPALGLWKKGFLLSQIMTSIAAQNAAVAAAQQAALNTTPAPITSTVGLTTEASPSTDDEEDQDEDATINEIVKRYAPAIRKKIYGSENPYSRHNKKAAAEGPYENKEVDADEDNDDEADEPTGYKSGSFNKFGTGPAGSPNGVGYDQGKINQAGCSGSHIRICSGTTIYLTNPDDDSVQKLDLAFGEDAEDDAEDETDVPEAEADQDSTEKGNHGSKKQKSKHGRDH